MANKTFQPARAYGDGAVGIRGGFCPYGSTAGGSSPVIPIVPAADPTSNSRPQWGALFVGHDATDAGKFRIVLDDDYQDLNPLPEVEVNRYVQPASVFVGSTTQGSGLLLVAIQAGPQAGLTVPLKSVVLASGGAGTTSSAAISSGVITITAKTSATIATAAANINANAATLGVNAIVVGTSTDVLYVGAYTWYFSGGQNSGEEGYASAFVSSDTSGDGILYTAVSPGAVGNDIRIVYLYSGSSNAAAAVAGNIVTVTIPTSVGSTTNATILASVLANCSALVNATLVSSFGSQPSAAHYNTGVSDTNTTTSKNVGAGTALTGGGLASVVVAGRINPHALADSGIQNIEVLAQAQRNALPTTNAYSHFNLRIFVGDTPTDLNAASQLFVPSATQGSGVIFNSVATAATKATTTVYSASGAPDGVLYSANQPGDAGNNIAVVYLNPQATAFVPSTTGGDGLLFQAAAAYAGQAGQQISVYMAAPNANSTTTVVQVNGLAISIFPKNGETNAGVSTAVAANATAANLVGTPTATGGGDLVTGNYGAKFLGGGYVAAAGTAVATIAGDPTTGYLISVQFGTNATNTQVSAAVNAVAVGPYSVVAASVAAGGSDHVVFAGAQSLAGGSDTTDLQVQYTGPLTTTVSVAATLSGGGTLATLTVASTANFPSAGTIDLFDTTGALETLAYTGTTATTFTTLTGGTASRSIAVGAVVSADAVVAVQTGNQCLVYLGYTAANNTNAAIAAAANGAQPGAPLMTAVPWGTATDLNPMLASGVLSWPGPLNMECNNLVRFRVDARTSAAVGP